MQCNTLMQDLVLLVCLNLARKNPSVLFGPLFLIHGTRRLRSNPSAGRFSLTYPLHLRLARMRLDRVTARRFRLVKRDIGPADDIVYARVIRMASA